MLAMSIIMLSFAKMAIPWKTKNIFIDKIEKFDDNVTIKTPLECI